MSNRRFIPTKTFEAEVNGHTNTNYDLPASKTALKVARTNRGRDIRGD